MCRVPDICFIIVLYSLSYVDIKLIAKFYSFSIHRNCFSTLWRIDLSHNARAIVYYLWLIFSTTKEYAACCVVQ